MQTTTIITDELYALLAAELWWKIQDCSWCILSTPEGIEIDRKNVYLTLYGLFRMQWQHLTDSDGTTFDRLHDISGERVELLSAQAGEETRNNFQWNTLRRWLLDYYGY